MIGITEAANALEAARNLLDATQLTATFDTKDGEVMLIVDRIGLVVVHVNGEPIEIGGHGT